MAKKRTMVKRNTREQRSLFPISERQARIDKGLIANAVGLAPEILRAVENFPELGEKHPKTVRLAQSFIIDARRGTANAGHAKELQFASSSLLRKLERLRNKSRFT